MTLCSLPEFDDRIQSRPYTPPPSPDCLSPSSAFPTSYQYCGYLDFQNNPKNTKWNRKFFMISNNFMLSAATPISLKLDQIIYLEGCTIKNESNTIFQLYTENEQHLIFRTSSSIQYSTWICAIQKASKFKIKDIYRFLYILGTSGMTRVVAAKHRISNEESAIKIVDKRICNKAMLKTEIQILKKLDNEYIVNLYDVIETKKYLYIAMEMCLGGELFDKIVELDGDHYSEQDCCLIMHQVAKGVKYMHSLGIIHRDLKPENILCVEPQSTSVRRIKIADFGISKICNDSDYCEIKEDEEDDENMETMLCSISYTAPEILGHKQYDYRADYYSIGVILYILLCGYPPFYDENGQSDACLIKNILKHELAFDDKDWEHVSNETKNLVKGLLCKDPSKRKTCDDILKLVWKVTNSSISYEKARENFKQHVLRTKMKNYSFSAYNIPSNELYEDNRLKKTELKRGSVSCVALPGIAAITPNISSSDLSLSSAFVFCSEYDEE